MAAENVEKIDSLPSAELSPGTTAVGSFEYDLEAGKAKARRRSCLAFWTREPSKLSDEEVERRKPITRSLKGAPIGYHEVALFQAGDRNFLQYRGFCYLHARLLLQLQYDVERLERELDALDQWDMTKDGDQDKLRCRERDDLQDNLDRIGGNFPAYHDRTRPEVMAELKSKLMEYDEVMLKSRDMLTLQRPSPKDYRSVRDWIMDYNPLVDDEQNFIRRKEDIITLRSGRECAGFDTFIERMLSKTDRLLMRCNCDIIQRLFITQEGRDRTSSKQLHYYAPHRVDVLVNLVVTVIIFILLVLPVVAMYELSDIGTRASPFEAIGILIIFTLLFGGAMSALTKAKREELFAASAAYCAVLVVFIGNFQTQTVVLLQ